MPGFEIFTETTAIFIHSAPRSTLITAKLLTPLKHRKKDTKVAKAMVAEFEFNRMIICECKSDNTEGVKMKTLKKQRITVKHKCITSVT